MALYLLSEAATGYALIEVVEADVIASKTPEVTKAMAQFARFSKLVKLTAFKQFTSSGEALDETLKISEGIVSDTLKDFLESNLPSKKKKFKLGVFRDPKMKSSIAEALPGINIVSDEHVEELLRGVRTHMDKMLDNLKAGDMVTAQLGLAHSYSRAKVKFNVHKSDNMIIQSIALLDQLDKDINTFSMRVREWYSWHFPELAKIVTDNIMYARMVSIIRSKEDVNEQTEEKLKEVLNNDDLAHDVMDAARSSMGTTVSEIDLVNIEIFAARVVNLAEYRLSLQKYLESKMTAVAPNLSALVGDQIGARLISSAGSLTSLAKYPASTVQILGAEKALFRALKTRGKTPKYGLLYNSSFIGRAKLKNKGRISRYVANKCSIASRMDCFSDVATNVFGMKLREQVEERLTFYEKGTAPRKNLDVMKEAMKEVDDAAPETEADVGDTKDEETPDVEMEDVETPKKKKKSKKEGREKKSKKKADDEEEEETETPAKKSKKKSGDDEEGATSAKKSKKKTVDVEEGETSAKKSSKKKKRGRDSMDVDTEAPETPKKKTKKKKSRKSMEAEA